MVWPDDEPDPVEPEPEPPHFVLAQMMFRIDDGWQDEDVLASMGYVDAAGSTGGDRLNLTVQRVMEIRLDARDGREGPAVVARCDDWACKHRRAAMDCETGCSIPIDRVGTLYFTHGIQEDTGVFWSDRNHMVHVQARWTGEGSITPERGSVDAFVAPSQGATAAALTIQTSGDVFAAIEQFGDAVQCSRTENGGATTGVVGHNERITAGLVGHPTKCDNAFLPSAGGNVVEYSWTLIAGPHAATYYER